MFGYTGYNGFNSNNNNFGFNNGYQPPMNNNFGNNQFGGHHQFQRNHMPYMRNQNMQQFGQPSWCGAPNAPRPVNQFYNQSAAQQQQPSAGPAYQDNMQAWSPETNYVSGVEEPRPAVQYVNSPPVLPGL